LEAASGPFAGWATSSDQIDLPRPESRADRRAGTLSTRYGILTPYTSFLADERVTLHAANANFGFATEALQELQQVTGVQALQAEFKQKLWEPTEEASDSC